METLKSYFTFIMLISNWSALNLQLRTAFCNSIVLSWYNYCHVLNHSCTDSAEKKCIQRDKNTCPRSFIIHNIRGCKRICHIVGRIGFFVWTIVAPSVRLLISYYHYLRHPLIYVPDSGWTYIKYQKKTFEDMPAQKHPLVKHSIHTIYPNTTMVSRPL